MSAADLVAALTRQVADFPSPGIQFKDLTPVFADPAGLAAVTEELADVASGSEVIAAIDARGFLLGGAVAARLGIGVLAIRKAGKLPPPVRSEHYQLEYGTASLELPADGIHLSGSSVVIVDDVLATGGTIAAAHRLLTQAGADVLTAAVVIELAGLGGRDTIAPLPVHSVGVF
ncbi:adenine phosphoribosyltransferase [Mycobacterium sp.]|uniref:adenine phosphoribosyltransferase n=1 Tax=Mycobacterium sp. TaxID=1785 RepID=UPI0025E9CF89|nr:adenine phosphoribosyltransferase [Mycobacterium sp.]